MKLKILIIEDEILSGVAIQEELLQHEFDVPNPIVSAEKALTCINKKIPDLILVDINLAGKINGIQLTEMLRKKKYTFPIIIMSGYADQKTKQNCLAAGANSCLFKPICFQQITEYITKLLSP